MQDLFISIAVAEPTGLAPLQGVYDASKKLQSWAADEGMEIIELTDETGKSVDIAAIQAELTEDKLLNRPRVFIHFCGHGFLVNSERGWVLSPGAYDSSDMLDVHGFKDVIGTYGVKNISILSDCCLTGTVNVGNLSNGLKKGPVGNGLPPSDMFLSTRDGTASWVVGGTPIFSGCMIEALCRKPHVRDAVDPYYLDGKGPAITGESLATFLEAQVTQAAGQAGKVQRPSILTGLRGPAKVYRRVGPADPDIPAFELERQPKLDDVRPTRKVATELLEPSTTRGAAVIGLVHETDRWPIEVVELGSSRPVNFRTYQGKFDLTRTLAVQIIDKYWVFAPHFYGLGTTLIHSGSHSAISETGLSEIFWRGGYEEPSTKLGRLQATYSALHLLASDSLQPPDLQVILATARAGKHKDPLLGILAGYIYEAVGDLDSIRRTASYYPKNYQPIPIDLALMARCSIVLSKDGGLFVDLPGTPEAEPPYKDAPEYLWTATDELPRAEVAGFVPVFRRGWKHIDRLPGEMTRALTVANKELLPGALTTFNDASWIAQMPEPFASILEWEIPK